MKAMNAPVGQAARRVAVQEDGTGRGAGRSASKVNINRVERVASALLGGTLVARGITRPSPTGIAMVLTGVGLLYRGTCGHSQLYQLLDVSTAGGHARREAGISPDAPQLERSITILKSADELYRFWREPQNLSRIMEHFAEVTAAGEDRTHWLLRGPLRRTVEWDTVVVEDRPGEFLRWASIDGAALRNEGAVAFRPAPGDRGTEVKLRFRFDLPGGVLSDAAFRLLGVVPSPLAGRVLRRFKSLVETGEVPTTKRNPSARADIRDE